LRELPKEEDEYLGSVAATDLDIQLQSVAVVKVDAGSKFSSMHSSTKHARFTTGANAMITVPRHYTLPILGEKMAFF
jgi:hypothetical protein